MDPEIKNLSAGDILIKDEKIVDVGEDITVPQGAEVIDASDMIVMPGFVNTHIHTWQAGLRGLASDWTILDYLRGIHAGVGPFFKPEDICIGNLVGALNQINNGVTTVVDWHHNNPTPEHTDGAILGLEEACIRALFLHGSAKPPSLPDGKDFRKVPMSRSEVARLRRGKFSNDSGLLRMGLAILGPQIGMHDVCVADFKLAGEYDMVVSMHHSHGVMLAPDGYKAVGKEGLISRKTNIVHGNMLTDEDFAVLADHGATFSSTAEVEMQMAYGEPITGRALGAGATLALGTDTETCYASDMFAVMRVTMAAERHRVGQAEIAATGQRPASVPVSPQDALSWATIDGAKMACMENEIGSITPGKLADITMLRKTDLNLAGTANPVHAIVMYAHPGNVDTVLIAGKAVKRNGHLLAGNIEKLLVRLHESAERAISDFLAKNPGYENVMRPA